MKLQGEHTFDAPREAVWQAVLDPDVLAKVLPGCEDFQRMSDNLYSGTLKVKIGPVQGAFKGTVELSELDPPAGYQLHIKGRGAPGFVDGAGALELTEVDGGTRLSYDIDAKVGGRVATVGQRLLDSSAKVISRQAMEGLEQQIGARFRAESAASEAAAAERAADEAERRAGTSSATNGDQSSADRAVSAAEIAAAREQAREARLRAQQARREAASLEAPTQTSFAMRFARDLFRESVPEGHRSSVLAALAVAAVAGLMLLFKGC